MYKKYTLYEKFLIKIYWNDANYFFLISKFKWNIR